MATTKLGNGVIIPGEYHLFLKALKVFGKPGGPKDSETYFGLTKIFSLPSSKTATPSQAACVGRV